MFGKFQDTMKMLQLMQRLMKDEPFRAFINHPKVQHAFKDPEFQQIIQAKDMTKLSSSPKLAELMRDPEVSSLFAKVDFQKLLQQERA